MTQKKNKAQSTGLSDDDRLMFDNFKEWFNLKHYGKFNFEDEEFQSFIKDNGITLDYKSPIPRHAKENTIVYKKNKSSAVGDLARHIRNAHSHSRIRRRGDYFIMMDIAPKRKDRPKEVTMRGKIHVNLIQALLDAIRKNKCDRHKKQ